MRKRAFSYEWVIETELTASVLWELISDTNHFFKAIGHLPIRETQISNKRNSVATRHFTYDQIHRPELWSEDFSEWEAPFYLKMHRKYERGYLEELRFSIRISESMMGSKVTFTCSGISKGISGLMLTRMELIRGMKRKLRKIVAGYEHSVKQSTLPSEKHSVSFLKKSLQKSDLIRKLTEASGFKILSEKLVCLLLTADEQLLKNLSPVKLAGLWNVSQSDLLHVMLQAANLQIVNFRWNMRCPQCSGPLRSCSSLSEITEPIYCRDCSESVHIDFHSTLHLNFQPNPLVRKCSGRDYHIQNPALRPTVKLRTVLKPGEKRFVRINLDEGNYRISSDQTKGSVIVSVQKDGAAQASVVFTNWDLEDQHITLIGEPYLILKNQTEHPLTIICEDIHPDNYNVSASEISSLTEFRNLFPAELIREKESIAANDLTVLFTDLFNSTDIYNTNGDESAVSLVMNHFDVLQNVITEERGAIVKTIGDSVMAVFPRPILAVRAFNKAQEIFKNGKNGDGSIHLKGGVHTGNCVAVTLNNRIDYFGNTVNIASRLVDHARGDEIVISDDVYTCPDLRKFLSKERRRIRIHHFDAELKGFEKNTFEAKRISLQYFPYS